MVEMGPYPCDAVGAILRGAVLRLRLSPTHGGLIALRVSCEVLEACAESSQLKIRIIGNGAPTHMEQGSRIIGSTIGSSDNQTGRQRHHDDAPGKTDDARTGAEPSDTILP